MNNWGQYAFKFMQDFTVPSPAAVLATGSLALYVVGTLLLLLAVPLSANPEAVDTSCQLLR